MATIKIATCAFPATSDVAESVRLHLGYIEAAADAGASLVVFPEVSIQGYPADYSAFNHETVQRHVLDTAESVPDGPSVHKIINAAVEKKIHVVFGLTEAGEQAGISYNTLVLAGPDGYIGRYRKVHVGLPEKLFWRPGDEWPVFETAIGKIGLLICYDKMWPESCRELTLRGAEILIVGSAWGFLGGHGEGEDNLWARQFKLYDEARAVENGRWYISSNHVGEMGGIDFFGLARIIDPIGNVLVSSGITHAGLVMAEIDINEGLANARILNHGPFLIRDRRPETYRALNGDLAINIGG